MSDAASYLSQLIEARERGEIDRCLHLSACTIGAAEQERDWDARWRALSQVGILYLGRGEAGKAKPWYMMAMEAAKAGGLAHRIGGSAHDLFVTSAELDDDAAQRHWSPIALEFYKPFDRRLNVLLSDFALTNLRRGKDASYARLLWLGVWQDAHSSIRDRLIAATWLVVASAYTGIEEHYAFGLRALSEASAVKVGEHVAISLNRAVEAMLMRKDFERAYLLAGTAELAASVRGEDLQRERAAWLKDQADAARSIA